jgi:hypothetical protein
MAYALAKLIHLFSLIFWIGPPLGAYYILYSAHKTHDRPRIIWAERLTEQVLVAEHIAFVLLIASGVVMIALSGGVLLSMPWLITKLWLFGGVLAFELGDIFISHWVFSRIFREPDPFASADWPKIKRLRGVLAVAAIPVMFLIPAIFYVAVVKS